LSKIRFGYPLLIITLYAPKDTPLWGQVAINLPGHFWTRKNQRAFIHAGFEDIIGGTRIELALDTVY
jgi:hypothetical protein